MAASLPPEFHYDATPDPAERELVGRRAPS